MEMMQHRRLEAVPPSLTRLGSIAQNVLNTAGGSSKKHLCAHMKVNKLWTSAKIKPALFRANNSLPRKTCYVLHYFCCSYLKWNKVSRSLPA